MQPLSGNQRPDLLTSLMNMSPVLRQPRTMHLCRSSSFSTSQLPKVLRAWCVLYTCWLRHVLRTTSACTCSSLICPDGSAPATLASLLFDSLERQIIGKNKVSCDFSTISRTYIFFLLTLSLLWFFPPLRFHLSILTEVWLLNFLRLNTSCILTKLGFLSAVLFNGKGTCVNREGPIQSSIANTFLDCGCW